MFLHPAKVRGINFGIYVLVVKAIGFNLQDSCYVGLAMRS